MLIVLKQETPKVVLDKIENKMIDLGCQVHRIDGKDNYVLELSGNTNNVDPEQIKANEYVQKLILIKHPFKLASKDFHPDDTIVNVNGLKIGGGNIAIIAGPCAVESEDQIMTIAKAVKASGDGGLSGI